MKSYRSDIDGLRALAVLAVVFYHAGLGFPGGFVGVDVFFVISGFLITSLIAADLDRGSFSLANFWERRIRRIWPAAIATTLFTLAVGWWALLPDDFKDLASNAAAQVLMIANIRVWRNQANYFAAEAETNPLLHMWSLAVEEQFYIFLPLLMMMVWRFGSKWRVGLLAALGLGSFAASVFFIGQYPMAVFFLLPFRAWELLVGGLLALCPQVMPRDRRVSEATGVAGLLMIAHPCLAYGHATTFPGLAAVEPCLGAAALIAAGGGAGSTVTRWLESPVLRLVGRMSYSIYLWHWPLLAFLRYSVGLTLPPHLVAAAMVALVVLSYLSYRWIETPFRAAATPRARKQVVMAAMLGSATILVCCGMIRWAGGFSGRFPPGILQVLAREHPFSLNWEWKAAASPDVGFELNRIGAESPSEAYCFLLFGDSHGMVISQEVDAEARRLGVAGRTALKYGTLPFPGRLESLEKNIEVRSEWYDNVVSLAKKYSPKHIILCSRWSAHMPGEAARKGAFAADLQSETAAIGELAAAALRADLNEMLRECERMDATLWILLEVPFQPEKPSERALAAHWSGKPPSLAGVDRLTHDRRMSAFREAIDGVDSPRLRIVDLSLPLFAGGAQSKVGRDGVLWYWDHDHLNSIGARELLGPTIRDIMERVACDCKTSDPARGNDGAEAVNTAAKEKTDHSVRAKNFETE